MRISDWSSDVCSSDLRGTVVIDGEIQPVPVDREPLRLIAERTQGQFFSAESLGELENVYEDIGSSIGFDTEEQEVTDRFAGYAVVLVLVKIGRASWRESVGQYV